jgi:hypothetical protein
MRSLALFLLLAFVSPAHAWNKMGHMMVAAVAYSQLTPVARAQVDQLLTLNPSYGDWTGGKGAAREERTAERAFMLAAFWPDEIKGAGGYTDEGDTQEGPDAGADKGYGDHLRHRYWHYINTPISSDGTPVKEPHAPNVLTQINSLREVLADKAADPGRRSYALVWLLHLVGDVHQPLHTVSRFTATQPDADGGGNRVALSCVPEIQEGSRCPNNLHAFWDDVAGGDDLIPEVLAHVHELPRADAQKARIDDPGVWVQEGLRLAQSVVYVGPIGDGGGPFVIDEPYHAKARAVAAQQIVLAGTRLARLLNRQLR